MFTKKSILAVFVPSLKKVVLEDVVSNYWPGGGMFYYFTIDDSNQVCLYHNLAHRPAWHPEAIEAAEDGFGLKVVGMYRKHTNEAVLLDEIMAIKEQDDEHDLLAAFLLTLPAAKGNNHYYLYKLEASNSRRNT